MSPLKLGKGPGAKKPPAKTASKKKEVTTKETTEQIRARAMKKKPRERTATENAAMPAIDKPKKVNAFTAKAKAKKPNPFTAKAKSAETSAKKPNPFTARAKQASTSKLDFLSQGLKFHNARPFGEHWRVDVTNGDKTVTMHNRFGSWMSVPDDLGRMIDPPHWLASCCHRRMIDEMKGRGIPTPDQRRVMREEEEAKARRKRKKSNDEE